MMTTKLCISCQKNLVYIITCSMLNITSDYIQCIAEAHIYLFKVNHKSISFFLGFIKTSVFPRFSRGIGRRSDVFLLPLTIFHKFLQCLYVEFEQVNACWDPKHTNLFIRKRFITNHDLLMKNLINLFTKREIFLHSFSLYSFLNRNIQKCLILVKEKKIVSCKVGNLKIHPNCFMERKIHESSA